MEKFDSYIKTGFYFYIIKYDDYWAISGVYKLNQDF